MSDTARPAPDPEPGIAAAVEKRRFRQGAVGWAAVAAFLGTVAVSPSLPQAQAQPLSGTEGLNYVALGDSYAAGFGLPPSGESPPGCFRSDSNYPTLLATELGLNFAADVTCAGATTADLFSEQQTSAGIAPPQIEALNEETDIVSVTIGGNDPGFADIA